MYVREAYIRYFMIFSLNFKWLLRYLIRFIVYVTGSLQKQMSDTNIKNTEAFTHVPITNMSSILNWSILFQVL